MAACPRCAERNPEAARFCAACGAALPPRPAIPLETQEDRDRALLRRHGLDHPGSGRIRSRFGGSSRATSRSRATSSSGTVGRSRSSSATRSWPSSASAPPRGRRAARGPRRAELRDAIAELNDELEPVRDRLAVRIGVNSGEVIAGDTLAATRCRRRRGQRRPAARSGGGRGRDPDRRRDLPARARRGRPSRSGRSRSRAGTSPYGASLARGAPGAPRRTPAGLADGRTRARARALRARSCAPSRALVPPLHGLGAAGVGKSRLLREALGQVGDRARSSRHLPSVRGGNHLLAGRWEWSSRERASSDGDSPEEALAQIRATLSGDEATNWPPSALPRSSGSRRPARPRKRGSGVPQARRSAGSRAGHGRSASTTCNAAEPTFSISSSTCAEWARDVPCCSCRMARPDLLDEQGGVGRREAERNLDLARAPLRRTSRANAAREPARRPVADDELDRVQRVEREGNPLFVEEMVSMLIDAGLRQCGTATGGDPALSTRYPVPDSIQVLLASGWIS